MAAPTNILTFSDTDDFNYTPTAADTIIVCVGWRASTMPVLNVTDTVTALPVTVVLDQWIPATNGTLYNMTAIFRVQNTGVNMLLFEFSGGVTFGNGAYVVMQVANIDPTTPVNLAVNSPNIAGGTGPFVIAGTTTNTTSDSKVIVSAITLALNNSATVSGATIIQPGRYDGQLTLACAAQDQTTFGAFSHGYTSASASVRSPLVAVAYNIAGGGGDPDIAITEFGTPTAIKVFQRDVNSETVTFSGTYANGTPAAVEIRIIDQDTATPVSGLDWQTLDASPAGGTYSGSKVIPEGGLYTAEVRWSDDTGKAVEQAQAWGVGIGAGMNGQSNMQYMSERGTTPPAQHPKTSYIDANWTAVPAANGVREFLNELATRTGLPCFAFNHAVLSQSIDDLIDPSPSWSDFEDKLAIAGDIECVIMAQGERDGQLGTSQAAYVSSYADSLLPDYLAATGRTTSNFKIYISLLGNSNGYTSYTNEKLETIRDAQRELGTLPGFVLANTSIDQPLVDTIHLTNAGFGESGKRFAKSVAQQSTIGPRMTAVNVSGNDVIITVQQDSGTGLTTTGTGDFDKFEVSDDDFATLLTITGYSIDSATQITLTLSSTPVDLVKVRYCWGMDLVLDNVVVDNTALALPLFPDTITETTVYDVVIEPGATSLQGSVARFETWVMVELTSADIGLTASDVIFITPVNVSLGVANTLSAGSNATFGLSYISPIGSSTTTTQGSPVDFIYDADLPDEYVLDISSAQSTLYGSQLSLVSPLIVSLSADELLSVGAIVNFRSSANVSIGQAHIDTHGSPINFLYDIPNMLRITSFTVKFKNRPVTNIINRGNRNGHS